MKTILTYQFTILLLIIGLGQVSIAQTPEKEEPAKKIFVVIKNDGAKYVGEILSQDAREVLLLTSNLGEIAIPKHEIKEIQEVDPNKVKGDGFVDDELFATRYFLTTNGLPIDKGDSYMQLSIVGPDFQFGIADHVGVGVISTWFATPIIGTIKYSNSFSKNAHFAIGGLLGTGSWSFPDFALALPYGTLTLGDRKANLSFSSGYGGVWYNETVYNPVSNMGQTRRFSEGRILFSIGSVVRVAPKLTFVFDSFLMPQGRIREVQRWEYNFNNDSYELRTRQERSASLYVYVPGIRWQTDYKKAFQFGFAGFIFDGEALEVPIPMISWFRKI